MTARVTTAGVESGAAASTRNFFSAIRFGVSSDARTIGPLMPATDSSFTEVAYTVRQPLVDCALNSELFIYVSLLFGGAIYTFAELAFGPRLTAQVSGPIDLSPSPSIRIALCGDLRPSGE